MTRTILIIGGSSNIGSALIDKYISNGDRVIATSRTRKNLTCEERNNNLALLPLDIDNQYARNSVCTHMEDKKEKWDTVIFLNATTNPIGPFMDVYDWQWQKSILENALIPCDFLRQLYPLRRKDKVSNVVFFGGGGINNSFDNYSAYTISKIILMKMCELLDSEYGDLNPFIVGPGYVNTKIHQETLNNKEGAGEHYKKMQDFLDSGPGTSMDKIFEAVEWGCAQGKEVIGGRNLAVIHDAWDIEGGKKLAKKLKKNKDLLKLRRYV